MRGAIEFIDRINFWESILTKSQSLIDLLLLIQSKLGYLDPIFDSNDIVVQIHAGEASTKNFLFQIIRSFFVSLPT